MKKYLFFLFSLCYLLVQAQIDAGSVMGLPTANTTAEMNAITTAPAGSILYNLEENRIFVFDGTIWGFTSAENWLVTGNTGLPSTSFLGHQDDVRMEIRSNNLPLLQFGRRQTLGLTTGLDDYNDNDQPLVHINGDGTTAALQFAGAGTAYPPLLFSTPDGNFRIRGGAGDNDLFFLGSLNNGTDSEFEIVVGDDGAEAITFKNFNFRNGGEFTELMRVQGNANQANPLPRVAIGTNGNQANSSLQVDGSLSLGVFTTTGAINLNESHHTIIISGNHFVNLPGANAVSGRIYVLKNSTNTDTFISNYIDLSNTNQNTVPANTVIWLQSNGANWQLINNISGAGGAGGGAITYFDGSINFQQFINGNGDTRIRLNRVDSQSGGFTGFPYSNNQVVIPEAGTYEISYSVGINRTQFNNDNQDRDFEIHISLNGNRINRSRSLTTVSDDHYNQASQTIITDLNVGNLIGLLIQRENGSGAYTTTSNTVNIVIKKL